jgi:transcriptional regulator with XRE-family HTH domain
MPSIYETALHAQGTSTCSCLRPSTCVLVWTTRYLVHVQNPEPDDDVLAALDELVAVLNETIELNRAAIRRARVIRRFRQRGHSYNEIVPMEERPLIVELLTHCLSEVADASSRFRKAEARALYSEGLSMSEIAKLFGVTRQRVAMLLRDRSEGFFFVLIVAFGEQFVSTLGGTLHGFAFASFL